MCVRTSTFTSYINVEPDQAIDQKFAALERQAQQTFNKIAASAAKANSALAGRGGTAGMIGGADPIGRAACRERMCQYVQVSVDAVSLKKKTHSNQTTRNRDKQK